MNYRTTTPVILAVFEKLSDHQPAATWEPDPKTPTGLQRKMAKSVDADRQVHAAISRLADEQTPVMVWGTGAHSLRLLESSRLGETRITVFIDSHVRHQDKQLKGLPILAPDAVRGRSEPILISSPIYQQEICNRIQNEIRLLNRLVLLYTL